MFVPVIFSFRFWPKQGFQPGSPFFAMVFQIPQVPKKAAATKIKKDVPQVDPAPAAYSLASFQTQAETHLFEAELRSLASFRVSTFPFLIFLLPLQSTEKNCLNTGKLSWDKRKIGTSDDHGMQMIQEYIK